MKTSSTYIHTSSRYKQVPGIATVKRDPGGKKTGNEEIPLAFPQRATTPYVRVLEPQHVRPDPRGSCSMK